MNPAGGQQPQGPGRPAQGAPGQQAPPQQQQQQVAGRPVTPALDASVLRAAQAAAHTQTQALQRTQGQPGPAPGAPGQPGAPLPTGGAPAAAAARPMLAPGAAATPGAYPAQQRPAAAYPPGTYTTSAAGGPPRPVGGPGQTPQRAASPPPPVYSTAPQFPRWTLRRENGPLYREGPPGDPHREGAVEYKFDARALAVAEANRFVERRRRERLAAVEQSLKAGDLDQHDRRRAEIEQKLLRLAARQQHARKLVRGAFSELETYTKPAFKKWQRQAQKERDEQQKLLWQRAGGRLRGGGGGIVRDLASFSHRRITAAGDARSRVLARRVCFFAVAPESPCCMPPPPSPPWAHAQSTLLSAPPWRLILPRPPLPPAAWHDAGTRLSTRRTRSCARSGPRGARCWRSASGRRRSRRATSRGIWSR